MDLVPYIGWSLASALFCGLVAVALNRWASGWSFARRVAVATLASVIPAIGAVGIALAPSEGQVLLSMSPDEFVIPFILQIVMIIVVAIPVAWLLSRRAPTIRTRTDVFD